MILSLINSLLVVMFNYTIPCVRPRQFGSPTSTYIEDAIQNILRYENSLLCMNNLLIIIIHCVEIAQGQPNTGRIRGRQQATVP